MDHAGLKQVHPTGVVFSYPLTQFTISVHSRQETAMLAEQARRFASGSGPLMPVTHLYRVKPEGDWKEADGSWKKVIEKHIRSNTGHKACPLIGKLSGSTRLVVVVAARSVHSALYREKVQVVSSVRS